MAFGLVSLVHGYSGCPEWLGQLKGPLSHVRGDVSRPKTTHY